MRALRSCAQWTPATSMASSSLKVLSALHTMDPINEYGFQLSIDFDCIKFYEYVLLSITVLLLMREFNLILNVAQKPELPRAPGVSLFSTVVTLAFGYAVSLILARHGISFSAGSYGDIKRRKTTRLWPSMPSRTLALRSPRRGLSSARESITRP